MNAFSSSPSRKFYLLLRKKLFSRAGETDRNRMGTLLLMADVFSNGLTHHLLQQQCHMAILVPSCLPSRRKCFTGPLLGPSFSLVINTPWASSIFCHESLSTCHCACHPQFESLSLTSSPHTMCSPCDGSQVANLSTPAL